MNIAIYLVSAVSTRGMPYINTKSGFEEAPLSYMGLVMSEEEQIEAVRSSDNYQSLNTIGSRPLGILPKSSGITEGSGWEIPRDSGGISRDLMGSNQKMSVLEVCEAQSFDRDITR